MLSFDLSEAGCPIASGLHGSARTTPRIRAEILADYPMLAAGDITAALEYAARQIDHPVLRVA